MSVRYGGNGNAPSIYTLFLILWVLVFVFFLTPWVFFTVDQAN